MDVVFIERIAAFRAEFRRMIGIFGFPTAFVTPIEGSAGRFRFAALTAEFSLIDCTAGTGPSFCRPGLAAFQTKFAGIGRTARTDPAFLRLWFWLSTGWTEFTGVFAAAAAFPCILRGNGILPITHFKKILCVDAACLIDHSESHKSSHRAGLVGGGGFHCFGLGFC